MRGKINSGDCVVVEPVGERELRKNDIVLCKVKGRTFLHLIKALGKNGYLIGNNCGRVNGWTSRNNIYGICTEIK